VTATRQRLGRRAEDEAAHRLATRGYRILDRNARTRHGEIDIVAMHRGVLVFCEVKAGRRGGSSGPERPALAVGPRKQLRLRRLAAAWLADAGPLPWFEEMRFDVIGITFDGERPAALEHIRNAF
jgi:putative endonuclease